MEEALNMEMQTSDLVWDTQKKNRGSLGVLQYDLLLILYLMLYYRMGLTGMCYKQRETVIMNTN